MKAPKCKLCGKEHWGAVCVPVKAAPAKVAAPAPARKPKAPAKRHAVKPIAAPTAQAQRKRGRPLIEDRDKTLAAQKPWQALGMSRSSWYRRNPAVQS
jgi:hypothetical protein